jgi:hypothetical protein
MAALRSGGAARLEQHLHEALADQVGLAQETVLELALNADGFFVRFERQVALAAMTASAVISAFQSIVP